jgi:AraC family transcriptional regulator
MSLQMSNARSTKDDPIDLGSIDLSGINDGLLENSQCGSCSVEGGVTMSFVHLDVALALTAQDRDVEDPTEISCFKVSAKRLARCSEDGVVAPETEDRGDPVMRRLADALAAAEATPDHYSAICADALRLAIWTRKFSRQPGCGLPDPAASAGVVENPAGRNVRSLQKWRLKRVLQYVDDHLAAKITLNDLATVAGLSRMHFAAQFRAAVGMRPHQYLLKRRIERAEELLKQAEVSLVEIALTVGFQTQAHFTTVFKRFAGDTPYQWRSAFLAQSAPHPRARMSLS